MEFESAFEKLEKIQQQHLLRHWETLSQKQKYLLCDQIDGLDISTLHKQQETLSKDVFASKENIEPLRNYELSGNAEDKRKGKKLLQHGQAGCLIVAGGQGTRLRFDGPKGMFPVSIFKHKTLFQLFAEKVVAASKQANVALPLAIMTSPLNDHATRTFFKENNLFGLQPDQLFFFTQGILPFLDKNGYLFLEAPDLIAQGPDGNGSSLKHFVKAGVWDEWSRRGVKFLNYVLIDNPLADPFDAELLGYHQRQKADITIKSIFRQDAHEKVGILVKKEGKIHVVEYSELPQEESHALDEKGKLKHQCANLSLFCFDMDFVRQAAFKYYEEMPWHRAFKSVKYLSKEGATLQSELPMAWKFEKFIFDVLPFSDNGKVLVYPREQCFAPLKNYSGEDSIAAVQRALQNQDVRTFKEITGLDSPSAPFELSQDFNYPSQALLDKWRGKPLPQANYIEA